MSIYTQLVGVRVCMVYVSVCVCMGLYGSVWVCMVYVSAEDEYLHLTGLCMCLYVHVSVGMCLYVPVCAYFVSENDVFVCVCVFMAWRKPYTVCSTKPN